MDLSNIYLICMVIPAFELLLLVTSSENRLQDIYMTMIVALIAITNFSYFFLSTAKILDIAILANKIAYIGGVWIPLCTFMTVAKLCSLKIKPMITRLLVLFNLVVFAFVLSVGYSDIYYAEMSLQFVHGISALKIVYGPAHLIFYIMLFVETALSLYVVFYTCVIKRKSIPIIVVVLAILAVILPRMVYIVRRVFDFYIDIMPIAYTITGTLFWLAYNRMSLYDITLLIAKSQVKSNECGFIAFNDKKHLISFNNSAATFFPILKNSRIDHAIDDSSLLHREIVARLDSVAENNNSATAVIHHEVEMSDNLFLKVNIFSLYPSSYSALFSKKYYLVELMDNTAEHNYVLIQEEFNSILHGTLNKQIAHIQSMYDSVIRSMAFIISNRDGSTGQHVRHASKSVKIFLDALLASPDFNLTRTFCNNVEKAAPLHDIGKIGVDDAILKKPGKFSTEEYDVMKTHPQIGAEIIEQVFAESEDDEFKNIARNVANYHHERWDGSGYPEGLQGEEIPLEARIMALPDVFDALVSERVYKKPFSYDDAFSIISQSINTHFDPKLCEVFLSIKPQLIELYDELMVVEN